MLVLVLAGPLVPAAAAAPVVDGSAVRAAASEMRPTVRLAVSSTRPRAGERLWLAVRVSGVTRAATREVVVEQRRGTRWSRVVRSRTSASGRLTAHVVVDRQDAFRVRVLGADGRTVRTAQRAVVVSRGARTLEARAAALGTKRLGRPLDKIRTLTPAQRRATRVTGLVKVRSREYAEGVLVEVTRRASTRTTVRTWFVSGATGRWYADARAAKGRWGVPVADGRCGLLERGCVHRFSRGTAYVSPSSGAVASTTVTGDRGAMIAAARSQVGYVRRAPDPSRQTTKFNTWMGSRTAWCSFFQSWASQASGNGAAVPKIDRFRAFRSTTLRTLPSGTTPKVGALAFRHTTGPAGEATHVALVSEISGGRVRLVDGNTVGPLPAGHRGVLERWFPRSAVLYYVYPSY